MTAYLGREENFQPSAWYTPEWPLLRGRRMLRMCVMEAAGAESKSILLETQISGERIRTKKGIS